MKPKQRAYEIFYRILDRKAVDKNNPTEAEKIGAQSEALDYLDSVKLEIQMI